MTSYKQSSLIPGAENEKDTKAEPAKTDSGPGRPISPTDPPSPATAPVPASGWLVTPDGLESANTAGEPPRLVEYLIDKARLLQIEDGTAGVSRWMKHLARKSWVTDPTALLDAFEAALRLHYPDQTLIDLVATREHMLREWHRAHRRTAEADPLGYAYVPGEPTLRALARRQAEAAAARENVETTAAGADEAWLAVYPAEHRDVLRRHGVEPHVHPDAHNYNLRIIEVAAGGLAGDALARAADELQRAWILEEEKKEDWPDELDWYIEELIEIERDKRRGKK